MLDMLLDQLKSPMPEVRIEALCALAMLEEIDALPTLTTMWSTEQHPEVKQVIGWAGKQIHAAQQRGYTTIEGMAEAFRVHLTPDEADKEEQRKLAQIQTQVNIEQTKQHGDQESRAIGNSLKNAATIGAVGMAFGMGGIGMMGAMMSSMTPSIDTSHSLSDGSADKPKIGTQPIVPPRPSDTNIAIWLKKLADPNPSARNTAIVQLRDFNNPKALGPLGTCFAKDPDPAIRQAAQHTGKQLYFSALYWQDHDPSQNEAKAKAIMAKAQAAKEKRATQQ
jgi:hypothetical protein